MAATPCSGVERVTVRPVAVVTLVEDDTRIRQAVIRTLTDAGHAVEAFAAGMPALAAIVANRPDVVVLDLGLPDVDGTQLLRMVRGVSDVPIIAATARDDEASIISTLNLGADDYVVKPYSGGELDARIRAVLRRAAADREDTLLTLGDLVIDRAGRTAVLSGAELELSPKEFDLLAYLAQRPGEVVTKRELLAELWRQPWGGADKTVDVHLSWLRRKLGETAAQPRFLHTVRGVGIKLVVPAA